MRQSLLMALFAMSLALPSTVKADPPASTNKVDSKPQEIPRFFIVAPDRFHDELKEYVQQKQKTIATELISLETVLKETSGSDDPERLKRYLYEAWHKRQLKYVLLVGDIDVMPVRYMV